MAQPKEARFQQHITVSLTDRELEDLESVLLTTRKELMERDAHFFEDRVIAIDQVLRGIALKSGERELTLTYYVDGEWVSSTSTYDYDSDSWDGPFL